jgi:CheY-like chemotaxis protein
VSRSITRYTNAEGLPQAQVLSVFQDSRGYMWFGTYGGVARFGGVEYKVLTSADGLVGNVILAISESRGGRMFFGTSDGVTVLDEGRLRELKGPGNASIREVREIYTDTCRGRWIATAFGLFRERGGEVERFTEADGLPSSSVLAVTRDSGGYLWEVGKGTGLGLATVYGIIKQHGGYVYVESEPSKGTSFEIFLPSTREEVTSEEPPVARAAQRGNEVILIVEDEASVRRVAERWLAEIGYTVYAAEGPEQAEKIYDEHRDEIDLLLTDVVMPGVSGPELYRRLATKGDPPKVLYMSGYPDRGGHGDEIGGPGASFVQKPFDLDDLAETIRSVFDGKIAA